MFSDTLKNKENLKRDFEIYKGTTKGLVVDFGINKEPYEMKEDDTLKLDVFSGIDGTNVISKTITGDNYFLFTPEDTEELNIGFYRWNIKFTQAETGYIYQVVAPSRFQVIANE